MSPWIVDAGPFVFLAKLDRLSVLRGPAPSVLMPAAAAREVLAHPDRATQALQRASSDWLEIVEVEDRLAAGLLLPSLGPGEAEVIALARERSATTVVLDDLDARRFARRVGLRPVGTLGLLLAARLRNELPSLRAEILRLEEAGFYASDALTAAVLEAAGEAPP